MNVTYNANMRLMLEAMRQQSLLQQDLYTQLSSGKKINKPSDSPVDSHAVSIFNTELGEFDRLQQAVEALEPQLKQYDSIISEVQTQLSRCYVLGSEAASSTADDPAERSIIASELRSIQDQLVGLGNSTNGSDYIFSGTRTNVQPFTMDPVTRIVTYNGNNTEISVESAPNVYIKKNMEGGRVFMGTGGVFDSLTNLINAVSTSTENDIINAMDTLSTATKNIKPLVVENGQKLKDLENTKKYLMKRSTEIVSSISNLEDADLSKVASDLTLSQVTMNALYKAAASIGTNSLFSYMA